MSVSAEPGWQHAATGTMCSCMQQEIGKGSNGETRAEQHFHFARACPCSYTRGGRRTVGTNVDEGRVDGDQLRLDLNTNSIVLDQTG